MGEDFFKGFEQFVKNIGNVAPGGDNVSEDELSKASQMFKDMFKEHNEASDDHQNEDKKSNKDQPEGGAADSNPTTEENPFLSGYQNLQKDASQMNDKGGMGGMGGMPDLSNLSSMFQDSEFKDFFNNFTQNMFKEGGDGGAPNDLGEGSEMIENLMKEFTGFIDDNKDDPQLKDTFDKMMKDVVSKDSMYPPMKMMREELPKYLEDNFETLDQKDVERYNNQLDVIEEVCEKFENAPEDHDAIVELLYKLQEHGAPPQELLTKIQSDQTMKFPGMPDMSNLGSLAGLAGMGMPKEDNNN